MAQLTDIELLHMMVNGNEKAFRMLFERYYTPLIVYADKILTDIDGATDIVQSFFVSVYESRQTLMVQNVRSFMYQSVHNRCLNEIKHRNIHNKYASQTLLQETEEVNVVEEALELTETEARIADAISQLAPQCRRVFEMSRIEGFTNDEISQKLDISKRTVETQISKALKILREKLKAYD